MTDEQIKKAHPMHEGVPHRGPIFRTAAPAKPSEPEAPPIIPGVSVDKVALLVADDVTEVPRWEAYLQALGYQVYVSFDLNNASLLQAASHSTDIVVGKGWYTNPVANLALLLGKFLKLNLHAAYFNEGFAQATVTGLLPLTNPALNPVTLGQIERGLQ